VRGTKHEWAPGRWRLRVYVGRGEDGNPQQISRNVKGNVGEADAALRNFMAEIEKGRTKLDNPIIERVLDAWMANRRNATPSTRAGDQGYIDKRIVPAIGKIRLDRLKASDLDRAYTS
jgi:hypothetical protein